MFISTCSFSYHCVLSARESWLKFNRNRIKNRITTYTYKQVTWQSKAQLHEATKDKFGKDGGNDNLHMIDPPCYCGRRSGPVNSASQFLPCCPTGTHVTILNKREKQFKTPTKAISLLSSRFVV